MGRVANSPLGECMDDYVTFLREKEGVIDVINDLFIATDNRDWAQAQTCFAPRVLFDMSSLTGAEAVTLTPQEIVGAWDEGLRPLKAVHHQAGNYRVSIDEDEARAFCYGIAMHYLPHPSGRNTRVFVGSYNFHLEKGGGRWRIDEFKFNLKFTGGNLNLEEVA